jgi:hypothetical protein
MGKGGGRRRVGQVVRRHVHTLNRGNGAFVRGGDAFLQPTEVDGQGRLVPNGGRHTTQEGGHFGTGLGKPENVVDEDQHVLAFFITEIFRAGQRGKGHAGTGSRRLGHLTVNQGGFGKNAGILHLV